MLDDMLGERRKKLQALKDTTASNPGDDDDAASPSTKTSECPTALANEDSSCKPNPTIPKVADYKHLDISKAKRLINARESSIKSVAALIAKEEKRLS